MPDLLARSIAMLTILLAMPGVARSQTAPPPGPPPAPCVNEPQRHQFDFWIGEWDVTTKGGSPAGQSVIQSVSGGCAVLENWTSLRGGHGKSLNGYNPQTHQWQQFWIGQDGSLSDYRSSSFDGKSLTFFLKDDAKPDAISRLSFTPVDAATVRQFSESSTDGGKTWKTDYDFYYHRKTSSTPP
ncbi:MAG: hypothetical protein M3Z18_11485 [Gemmatimonadota bacterium]|nr:hypothetical protein [Gemmatimonadota bacterium]